MEVLRDGPRHLTASIDDPRHPYLRVRWPEGEALLALGSWHVVDGNAEALPVEARAWVQAHEPYLRRWSSIVQMGFQLRKAS